MRFIGVVILVALVSFPAIAQDSARPIMPTEALTKIDQKVTVQMEVKSTGGNTARFLNSEVDFKSERNFAIFVPNIALTAFQKAGAGDPGTYYYGKTILVSGMVALVQNRPQIRVEDPNQIKVVNNPAAPAAAAVKRAAK